jgi:GT2 family glycosyltransferase
MKVSVAIVTYNAIKYLDDCLKSIFSQTFKDFKVLVIDNASEDGTVEHLRKNYPQVTVLQNFKNLGLAKAYNQAIKFWESEYVLLANQDIILQLDFLEKLIKVAAHHPAAASFGGKILKLSHDEDKRDLGPEIIDTTGIVATKSRRFYDRGAGEEDKGQYDQAGEIFGLSANLVLYRREALEKVKIKNLKNREGFKFTTTFDYYEYFDEDFFMYKEDVDLAWRLQLAGYSAWYLPSAEAYHYRSAFGHAEFNHLITIKDRRRKSKFVNRLSYKNHWLVLVKNEFWSNFLLHLPWIIFYELKKFVYVLVLEVGTLKSVGEFFRLLPNIRDKRKQIKILRRVGAKEIRKWFK